ncbi:MAG: RNA 2'-phosphotransferase [Lachnospiraceae bacterium]|nr:RNA 2'-phosphotransferase [Lachnospiraceae bacterium]
MLVRKMKKISKFIAYILRHNPSAVGIELDEHGWADVSALIDGVCKTGRFVDMQMLEEIVVSDKKRRFAFNDGHTKIRANQGHSVKVDVEMKVLPPPDTLYHGTADKYIESIRVNGIIKQSRNYVHLSKDIQTALKVGSRHGKAVVLKIDARQMYCDGYVFLLSANNVWQTEQVPFKYVTEEIV